MTDKHHDPDTGSSPSKYPGSFLLAFRETATAMNLTLVRWLDDAVVCRDQDGEESTVGLENLYRRCLGLDRAEWPNLIREFLQNLEGSNPDALPDDINEVADQILPRVGPPIGDEKIGDMIWWHKLDEERVWCNLVIDFPTRMAYVTKEMIEQSGQSGEFWLDQAMRNLAARSDPDMVALVHDESEIRMIATNDSYDVARALILDDLLPESAEHGCFVAPIARDQVMVLPVTVEALQHVHILKLMANDNYPKAPYAISDEVFWVWQGQWYLFPVTIQDKQITVQPPREFVEVMNLLSPDDESDGEDDEDV